jgi:hypothetical protein
MVHHHEPTYVFRLTHELALRWATLSIVLFFVSVAGVSGFYQAIHGQTWTFISASNQTNQWSALVVFFGFIAVLFGQIIIHELIHGVAFAAFGGSPRYGVFTLLLMLMFVCYPLKLLNQNLAPLCGFGVTLRS